MNIEKFRMEKKVILLSAVLIALLLKLEKLYKKMWQKEQIFLVSILFKKLREEKGWGGGVVIQASPHIREKYSR